MRAKGCAVRVRKRRKGVWLGSRRKRPSAVELQHRKQSPHVCRFHIAHRTPHTAEAARLEEEVEDRHERPTDLGFGADAVAAIDPDVLCQH